MTGVRNWLIKNCLQAVESRAAESSAESVAEAASAPSPAQEAAAPVQTGVEQYFVALQPDEARPADAGTVTEQQFGQGSGEKYIPCGAGSIKNNTRQTAADIAAEAAQPLPFAIEKDSAAPQVLIMHTHATEDYRLSAGLWFTPGEIISGHRRKHAAELAHLDTVPVIVRNMKDDAATILMVDSNLQREHILPSERAFAYKMKMDAIKNQGARSDLTSSQVGTKLRADEKVAKDSGESRNQVQRFVRLTNLVPELLDMVDEKKISFNPAVELSYLDAKQQQDFLEAMDASQNAPSLSQAIRIKKLAQKSEFSYDAVYDIMNEEKKSELDTVTIKNETLRKYFPRSYTPRQMESIIIKLLDQWQLKKQQAKEKKQEEAR